MRYLDYAQGNLSLEQQILCRRFKKSADKIVRNPLQEVGLKSPIRKLLLRRQAFNIVSSLWSLEQYMKQVSRNMIKGLLKKSAKWRISHVIRTVGVGRSFPQ